MDKEKMKNAIVNEQARRKAIDDAAVDCLAVIEKRGLAICDAEIALDKVKGELGRFAFQRKAPPYASASPRNS